MSVNNIVGNQNLSSSLAFVTITDNSQTVKNYTFNSADATAKKLFLRLNHNELGGKQINLTYLRDELIKNGLLDAYATALTKIRTDRKDPSVTEFPYLTELLNADLSPENKSKLLAELQMYASAYVAVSGSQVNHNLIQFLKKAAVPANPAPAVTIPAAVAPTVRNAEAAAEMLRYVSLVQPEADLPAGQTDPVDLSSRQVEPFVAPATTTGYDVSEELSVGFDNEEVETPSATAASEQAESKSQTAQAQTAQDEAVGHAEVLVSIEAPVAAPIASEELAEPAEYEPIVGPLDNTDSSGEPGSLSHIEWKKVAIRAGWVVSDALAALVLYQVVNTDFQEMQDNVMAVLKPAADQMSSMAQSAADQMSSAAQSAAGLISSTAQSIAEQLPNVGSLVNPMRPDRNDLADASTAQRFLDAAAPAVQAINSTLNEVAQSAVNLVTERQPDMSALLNPSCTKGLMARVHDWTGATAQVIGSAVTGFLGQAASKILSGDSLDIVSAVSAMNGNATASNMTQASQMSSPANLTSSAGQDVVLSTPVASVDATPAAAFDFSQAQTFVVPTVEVAASAAAANVVNTAGSAVAGNATSVSTAPQSFREVLDQRLQSLNNVTAPVVSTQNATNIASGNIPLVAQNVPNLNVVNTAGSAVAGNATTVSTAPQSFREVLDQRLQSLNNVTAPVASVQNATNIASENAPLVAQNVPNAIVSAAAAASASALTQAAVDTAAQAAQVTTQNVVQNAPRETFEEWEARRFRETTVQPPKPKLSSKQPLAKGTPQTVVFPNGEIKTVRLTERGNWETTGSYSPNAPHTEGPSRFHQPTVLEQVVKVGSSAVNAVKEKVADTFKSIFGIRPSLESLMQDPYGFASTVASNVFVSIKNSMPELASDAAPSALAPQAATNTQPSVVSNQTVGSNATHTTAPLNQTVQAAPQPAAMPQANVSNQKLAECAPRTAQPSLPTCEAPLQSPLAQGTQPELPTSLQREMVALRQTQAPSLGTVGAVVIGALAMSEGILKCFRKKPESRASSGKSDLDIALRDADAFGRLMAADANDFFQVDGPDENLNEAVANYANRSEKFNKKLEQEAAERNRINKLKHDALEYMKLKIADVYYSQDSFLEICQSGLPPVLRNRIDENWIKNELGIRFGEWQQQDGRPVFVTRAIDSLPGSELRRWITPMIKAYYDPDALS